MCSDLSQVASGTKGTSECMYKHEYIFMSSWMTNRTTKLVITAGSSMQDLLKYVLWYSKGSSDWETRPTFSWCFSVNNRCVLRWARGALVSSLLAAAGCHAQNTVLSLLQVLFFNNVSRWEEVFLVKYASGGCYDMVLPGAGVNRNFMVHSGAYRKLSNLTLDGHRGCSQRVSQCISSVIYCFFVVLSLQHF